MRTRTLTIASFFSVAMAATLLGALFTTQLQRPQAAEARSVAATVPAERPAGTVLTLDTFKDVARANNAGVVNINTSKMVKLPRFRDPFHDFFGGGDEQDPLAPQGGSRPDRMRQTSLGSGFVIDKDGFILTNRHVIEGADEISVTFPSGKHYDAKVVGRDARTDVALLKIEATETLTPLTLGDSDKTEVGEWVMAIGNPFGLGGNSVTVGVVSFKGERAQLQLQRGTNIDMIQTDAAINPGNSGGPLLNTRGEVIGINTMIVTDGMSRGNAGVGFSVPINVARQILPQLREKGKVTRGWMGVNIQAVTEDLAKTYGLQEAKGALVSAVTPGSPAEKAGLKPEDVILSADGRTVNDNGDLSRYVASRAPGSVVKLEVLRDKDRRSVSVTLGTFPDEEKEAPAEESGRVKLGMTLRELSPSLAERLQLPRGAKGVVAAEVEPGGAADDAGLTQGDVIVSVNGVAIESLDGFDRAVANAKAAGRARLRVLNGQVYRVVVLKLK